MRRPDSHACAWRPTSQPQERATPASSGCGASPRPRAISAWTGSSTARSSPRSAKLRAETRKILGLPDLPLHATCVRVPVLVGHAQAVWVETESPLSPDGAREALASSDLIELADLPTPGDAAGQDRVLVGRDPQGHGRRRPRSLDRQRQPAQGRGPERRSDRRAPARAAPGRPTGVAAARDRPRRAP